MFDLELEWTVGEGGGERWEDGVIFISWPSPLFSFNRRPLTAIKIKESSHNLLSNCSLITFAPKTTSALQAKIEDALEAFAAEIN